jgi:hypothetical protein
MKKLTLTCIVILTGTFLFAQTCPSGTSRAMLNWNFLDFFPSAGYGTHTNLAQSQSQKFSFGAQVVTMTHNYSGSNAVGINASHTGHAGSYGTGSDVQFISDGVIRVSFQNAVENVRFSLYDVDYNQRATITALNGVTAQNVFLSKVTTTTNITITGSGTTAPYSTANSTFDAALTTSDATVNVDIPGPVTSFEIVISQSGAANGANAEKGAFWLSQISACSAGSFPLNYQNISQPRFIGQPGYVLNVVNNSIYYVDPATGKSRFLFRDNGNNNINSLAYDPVNKYVYYTYSLSNNGSVNANNRTVRRYDYNMDTFGIFIPDVRHLGIPTFTSGVESAGASFYNGSLYLGIESNGSSGGGGPNSSTETYNSNIWKIDFDNNQNPVSAVLQFSLVGNTQDWADFGVHNGTLIDYNAGSSAAFHHMNLTTNEVVRYNVATGLTARQTGIDWQGKFYNVGDAGSGSSYTIVEYNGTSGVISATSRIVTYNGVNLTGSYGDAAEAFTPKLDFGDAPASYEGSGDPAVHEYDPRLRLGATEDVEWNKKGATALANSDTDDGLAYTTILSDNGTYLTTVTAFNNTGANATVVAWMDFNGDGIFTADEGISVTIPSSASMQAVDLYWDNASTQLPANTNTYLRIRITSAANGMTTSHSTGYFYDGEVEDYRVLIELSALTANRVHLTAKKINNKHVKLQWSLSDEKNINSYILEKSSNGRTWNQLSSIPASNSQTNVTYEFDDHNIDGTTNYYRVKVIRSNNSFFQSDMKKIVLHNFTQLLFFPNPASNYLNISIQSEATANAKIVLTDMSGRTVVERNIVVQQGNNQINMPFNKSLAPGIYNASVLMNNEMVKQKIVVAK